MTLKPQAIDNFRASIEFKLEMMCDVLRVLEEGIHEIARKDAKGSIGEGQINLDAMEELKKWTAFMRHQQIYGFELPLRVRYSYVLQLYTLFETDGLALCDEIGKRKSLSITVDDLAGERSYKGIQLFFTKVFPVTGIDWSGLQDLKDLRNCVVHCGGLLKNSKQQTRLRGLAVRFPKKLKVLDSGYIFVCRSYCAELLAVVAKFFGCCFNYGGFGKRFVLYRIGHAQELVRFLSADS